MVQSYPRMYVEAFSRHPSSSLDQAGNSELAVHLDLPTHPVTDLLFAMRTGESSGKGASGRRGLGFAGGE